MRDQVLKQMPDLPASPEMQNWEIRDFSEGLIDKADDNLLPENAARDCQNFIGRYIGSLKKRGGQARLNPEAALGGPILGLYAYYYGTPIATRRLVAAANGVVAWWDFKDKKWTNLKTGLKTTNPFMFETCVNYMVCFNGLDKPWKWNGTTVSDLANAPADGQFPVLHKEKLFVVPVTDPSAIYWSESFQPEEWPEVNFWKVKEGDGDEITCLKKHLGELIIFKRRSIHSLRGTSLDDFRLEEMDSRLGCVGPLAAAALGPYLYFVSDEGLCVFNGMSATNISAGRIPKLWDRINKEKLNKAAVGVWDNIVWFALPEGESTYNNLVIAYIPGSDGGKFWPWRGINASCFQPFDDGAKVVLYAGDSNAGYINQQDIGTDDFGDPIHAYWEGRAFDQGLPEYEKKAKHIYVQDSPETINAVMLQISLDYGNFNTLNLKTNDGMIRDFLLPHGFNKWRYLTPRLSHDQIGPCEVRGLLVPYKTGHKPKVR
jgi:hypothetical protein